MNTRLNFGRKSKTMKPKDAHVEWILGPNVTRLSQFWPQFAYIWRGSGPSCVQLEKNRNFEKRVSIKFGQMCQTATPVHRNEGPTTGCRRDPSALTHLKRSQNGGQKPPTGSQRTPKRSQKRTEKESCPPPTSISLRLF